MTHPDSGSRPVSNAESLQKLLFADAIGQPLPSVRVLGRRRKETGPCGRTGRNGSNRIILLPALLQVRHRILCAFDGFFAFFSARFSLMVLTGFLFSCWCGVLSGMACSLRRGTEWPPFVKYA